MINNLMFPKYNNFGLPSERKIVFLDIDGVINPTSQDTKRFKHDLGKLKIYLANKYHDTTYCDIPETDIGGAFYEWDLESLGRLKKVLDYTYSEVVIHSDLIIWNDLKNFKSMFKLFNMDEYIVDTCKKGYTKIEGINEYLNNHRNIDNYVVIDDNPDLSIFTNHFVLTRNHLTNANVEEAIKILEK